MDVERENQVNVLLVDDRPENLVALEAILNSHSYNLVQANSGAEALRCLLNDDFAVILLDVQMPGMDGFETATLIRSRDRSRSTPIIFVTAFSSNDTHVFKGYSLGAVDYLFKPLEPEILTSKVQVFVELFQKTAEVKRQATQLAAVNNELSKSEERFRTLCACSPLGIYLADVEGRCTYMNPRCQEISGLILDENLVSVWQRSVHPENRDRVVADWLGWIKEGHEYSSEFRLVDNEDVRWIHVQSSPMFSDLGKLIGHVGTVRDITDRKQAEEERGRLIREQVARQEAERANQMKDEFLAILSHELRTPLNAILGWSRLLRAKKFDQETIDKALETIERNAKSQAQLVEDILDVSRILRGKLNFNLYPIQLKNVIEMAIDSLKPLAETKSIVIEFQSDSNVGKVIGDSDRLQQVIWNLLSNAIKFTPEEGKIEVRLKLVGDEAQIQIIDSGIGIAPDFLPYVFDRFRQADSSTTRSYGGLGLGLAIVRHLVEQHGGKVGAQNNTGEGAKFTVSLPVAEDNGQGDLDDCSELNDATEALPTLANLQLLVVDDDDDTREFLIAVLEDEGAVVRSAASVAGALAALESSWPDVLLSDIGMPGADGYELIARVREMEVLRDRKMPAIALTAYVRESDRRQALEAGFQMHLSKPVEVTKLIAGIANVAGILSNPVGLKAVESFNLKGQRSEAQRDSAVETA
ncbi:response regulator [Lyngbya sp. CCAP 1446/10]|uniref:hybrid sensor histidine kinase/response regulator n=1 Tax=Lyngbya sp. CCAP 1446/10 TaxID=439293 RepID=UPI002238B2BA|nr:response regulator [Lyngbya sp. CCAP 1446/10]MCW6051678.1 response regulator [Lyngbya sp. CCAP 1446/10]